MIGPSLRRRNVTFILTLLPLLLASYTSITRAGLQSLTVCLNNLCRTPISHLVAPFGMIQFTDVVTVNSTGTDCS